MRRISLPLVILVTGIALFTGLWIGHGNAASLAAAPGTDQDPLVTKSYIDQVINTLNTKIDGMLPSEPGTPPTVGASLRVVQLAAGECLIAYEGTEFILRSGNATAIGSAGGGIPDLTEGNDLPNHAAIPANHLLLFPRSDQRGIRAATNIIVMVRGEYSIEP